MLLRVIIRSIMTACIVIGKNFKKSNIEDTLSCFDKNVVLIILYYD